MTDELAPGQVAQRGRLRAWALALSLVTGVACKATPTEPLNGVPRAGDLEIPGVHGAQDWSLPDGHQITIPALVPLRGISAEARDGLAALLTGEQVYLQRWGTFTDVADAPDALLKLGVALTELTGRWAFSVNGASETGFIAMARGRPGTKADGIVVTLRYERGRSPVWTVRGRTF